MYLQNKCNKCKYGLTLNIDATFFISLYDENTHVY